MSRWRLSFFHSSLPSTCSYCQLMSSSRDGTLVLPSSHTDSFIQERLEPWCYVFILISQVWSSALNGRKGGILGAGSATANGWVCPNESRLCWECYFFVWLQVTTSTAEKTGSKLGPMTQPYLPLALALPAWSQNSLKPWRCHIKDPLKLKCFLFFNISQLMYKAWFRLLLRVKCPNKELNSW